MPKVVHSGVQQKCQAVMLDQVIANYIYLADVVSILTPKAS